MRRIWIIAGFVLGALFAWSLGHKARQALGREERMNAKLAPLAAEAARDLAMKSAIDGVDYTSDAYWEQELAQYQDLYDKWEKGTYDNE